VAGFVISYSCAEVRGSYRIALHAGRRQVGTGVGVGAGHVRIPAGHG